MSFSSRFIALLLLFTLTTSLAAQDATVIVPDVSGLAPAEAGALLNQAGLFLGGIDFDAPVPANEANPDYSIMAQSPQANNRVEAGSIVDVTLRYYNVLLRYDGNEFHLINLSSTEIGLHNLTFESGNRRYQARSWGDKLTAGNCVQVWTINVNNFYEPQECGFVQGGIGVQRNAATGDQFWTEGDEAQTFRIVQNGIVRGECPLAVDAAADEPEDTCVVWLASHQPPEDVTEYLYFIYDSHNFYVQNRSASQWMPLASIDIQRARSLVETRFFDFEPRGDLNFLAPQQCLFITDGTPLAEAAQPITTCDVVVQSTYTAGDRFWINGFTLDGVLDVPSQRKCPPVVEDKPSVCLVPR